MVKFDSGETQSTSGLQNHPKHADGEGRTLSPVSRQPLSLWNVSKMETRLQYTGYWPKMAFCISLIRRFGP